MLGDPPLASRVHSCFTEKSSPHSHGSPAMPHETMTSRQRMLAALNHETPDRVPIDLGGNQTGIHKFAYQALLGHLGLDEPLEIMDAVQQLARPAEAVLQRFHVDTRYIAAGAAADFQGGIVGAAARRPAVARPDRRVRRHLVDARRSAVLHGHLAPSAGRGHAGRHRRLSVSQGRRSGPVRRPPRAGPAAPPRHALCRRQRHLRRGVRDLLVPARPGAVVHGPADAAGVLRGPAGPDASVLARLVPRCFSTKWATWST